MKCPKCANEVEKQTMGFSESPNEWQYICMTCRNRKKYLVRKQYWVDEKGGKCFMCNKPYELPCYDFHHIDPKIKRDINLGTASEETITEEMSKCILVCANCHRVLTL